MCAIWPQRWKVRRNTALRKCNEQSERTNKNRGTIIADLSHDKPNVYYELGYAHGLGREQDVILLTDDTSALHFDVRDLNAISYDGTTDLEEKLKKRLSTIFKKEQ